MLFELGQRDDVFRSAGGALRRDHVLERRDRNWRVIDRDDDASLVQRRIAAEEPVRSKAEVERSEVSDERQRRHLLESLDVNVEGDASRITFDTEPRTELA